MEFLKVNAKAVAAFVATVLLNSFVDLVNGARPWPQSTAEWVQYLGTAFGAAVVVWGTGNKLTAKQVKTGLPKLPNPGAVVAAALPAMVDSVQKDVLDRVLDAVPPQLRDVIKLPWD